VGRSGGGRRDFDGPGGGGRGGERRGGRGEGRPGGASTEGSTGKGWTTAWTGWRSVWSGWRSAWSGVKDATLDSPILPDPGRAEVLIEDPGVSEEPQ
jgi:hypothetical protein